MNGLNADEWNVFRSALLIEGVADEVALPHFNPDGSFRLHGTYTYDDLKKILICIGVLNGYRNRGKQLSRRER